MKVIENKMKHFLASIRMSLVDENYYAALSIALIMPDICSKLETPNVSTNKRYPQWFDEYVGDRYISYIGADRQKHIFLSGQDAYSLRCSFLHQGEFDITQQYARESLNNFMFIEPPENGLMHNNKFNDTLQLQVDVFCEDICVAVEKWIEQYRENVDINSRALNIMEIKSTI